MPDGVPPDWRPYEYGHWVYTDDWGWYWVSDDHEEDWGWVVYHYGRWAHDRGLGWFWMPGDEWAPAWVDWRYGGDDIGWAPLPPDDLVDAYDDNADYWSFVPLRYIGEPELRRYYVPRDRRTVLLRDTRIINRPVTLRAGACGSIRAWRPALSPAARMWRCMPTTCARACSAPPPACKARSPSAVTNCTTKAISGASRRSPSSAPPRRLRRRRTCRRRNRSARASMACSAAIRRAPRKAP